MNLPKNQFGNPAITFIDVADPQTRPRMDRWVELTPSDRKQFDLVIIGGGNTGLSAARHAVQQFPHWKIALFDAGQIGSGPSGKSAGHVCTGFEIDQHSVTRNLGEEKAAQLAETARRGPTLVRDIIKQDNIACDVRPGYVYMLDDGKAVTTRESFGLEPYPFLLGLAQAARQAGVRIFENMKINALHKAKDGVNLHLDGQAEPVRARYVIAAGGHVMGGIRALRQSALRYTVDLSVANLITEPLPPEVRANSLPQGTAQERLPGSNTHLDVEYWSLDRAGRLIFGSRAGDGQHHPRSLWRKIKQDLTERFPRLEEEFRRMTGKPLAIKPFVEHEMLSHTVRCLPNVGQADKEGRVLFVNGLGGHGLALGTLLGREAVEKIKATEQKNPAAAAAFDLFASIGHVRQPVAKPLRRIASRAGVAYVEATRMINKWRGPGPESPVL